MKKRLPKFLEPYFWDVEFKDLDFQSYPEFVTERVLEYGNKRDLKWLISNVPQNFIKETIKRSVRLSRKSANFWSLIFN